MLCVYSCEQKQEDRQCTYNLTLRRLRELLLSWNSSKYYLLVCVCVRARMWVPGARGRVPAHTCI